MPHARSSLINLVNTPYYHCVSRCVRRAFLCGEDNYSGRSYEHRRQWVVDRIHKLSQIFAIDVCAYAVMSNHTHLVLHINSQQAIEMSPQEVIARWHKLYKGTLLTHQAIENKPLSKAQCSTLDDIVSVWRKRLYDVSWFMRSLNEYIARLANKEDQCTGRFWEGRFKSQALLGKAALAACMAYVDLNPVRANMASSPETSKYTSIQYRINAARAGKRPKFLMPFSPITQTNEHNYLPFKLFDYLELIDTTGRKRKKGSTGIIDIKLPMIVKRLNIAESKWLELVTNFEAHFHHAVGNEQELLQYQKNQKLKRIRNIKTAKLLLG